MCEKRARSQVWTWRGCEGGQSSLSGCNECRVSSPNMNVAILQRRDANLAQYDGAVGSRSCSDLVQKSQHRRRKT